MRRLQNQQLKTPRLLIDRQMTQKSSKSSHLRCHTGISFYFLFEKRLKSLIDHQNSWWLIYYWSINRCSSISCYIRAEINLTPSSLRHSWCFSLNCSFILNLDLMTSVMSFTLILTPFPVAITQILTLSNHKCCTDGHFSACAQPCNCRVVIVGVWWPQRCWGCCLWAWWQRAVQWKVGIYVVVNVN